MSLRRKNPTLVMQLGMVAMILAMVLRRVFHLGEPGASDLSDALLGMVYGVSIALLLLSVWMRRGKPNR